MRKFIITVNGKSYEVEVEELTVQTGSAAVQLAPVTPAAPASQPAAQLAPQAAAAPKQEKAAEQKSSAQPIPSGAELVKAPMPGTILDVKVNVGDEVKRGQVLLILEAMKMENEIMAPRDGKVVSIQVSKGASVNAEDVLVALQ
ncbi:biotin/lipoyl-binding protein [Caldicoprobacter algeriensis]|uniref:biotin/lipoyl-containing protein n=1 Tax=Caldicoprobacter algeriensis TaxID=699281 RepID=UPI00207B0C81|nr:biotin/lipoyl-containing protein [Caldicoprobacter algeriensis]MCM8900856.1 biotin/lipoyl-binding protein [Caldicoprobacter algeriensis]